MSKDIRKPIQDRSKALKKKILKNARDIFSKKGLHNTTTNEIANKAGVSIGSLYSYFPNKESIYLECLDEFLKEFNDSIFSEPVEIPPKIEKKDLKELISLYIKRLFDAFTLDIPFHRQSFALKHVDDRVKALYDKAKVAEIEFIESLLETMQKRFTLLTGNISAGANTVFLLVENAAHTIKHGSSDLDEESLIEEMSSMIFRYLFGE